MKRPFLFALVAILILGSATLQSCVKDHLQPPDAGARLQLLTDSLYQHLNQKLGTEKNKGGLFLQVNSPAGSNLVSTNIEPGVQANSHFRIASLSKTFTAAAIMLLEQRGKLKIDDFIPAYLPATPAYDIPNKDKITIRQLLQHRAGVFDVTNQEIPETVNQPYAGKNYAFYVREDLKQDTHTFTFDELVGVVARNKLFNFAPGTTFGYTNTGYNLLGKIIEIASGMSYSDFIRTQFLEPLRLTNTYGVWQGTDNRMKDPFINSYLYVPGQPVEATPEDNLSMHVTEGDMVSTPADITRWIELLMTGKAGLTPQTVARMQEMEVADGPHGVYGLGITFNEGLGFGHDGAHLSFVSTLRYNPANKTTVLMVANFIAVGGPPATPNANFLEVAYGVRYTALRAAEIVNR